ncbi:MAG: hypothetical protein NDJ90_09360 [Oligoflexia bacterium]|nr:hypothetical protein [Oligoflexia bacterium]
MIVSAFLFSVVTMSGSLAGTRLGYDGCYQIYMPGVMYPAFCLEGTAEEGIGGAGVRLAIFKTNTSRLASCLISTASGMGEDSFVFERDGKKELSLENVRVENNRREGDVIVGRYNLKFMEINDRDTDRLLNIANSSTDCFR